MLDKAFEEELLQKANLSANILVAGIDEVGRGPLAGPVVACACVVPIRTLPWLDEVKDSKLLSKTKRNKLYQQLIINSHYGIGMALVSEIDTINILNATKLAMVRAYSELVNKCSPNIIFIDGRDNINLPPSSPKAYPVIKGDSKILAIAAASIIAKVTRDNIMEKLSKEQNNIVYSWEKNAGYGTKHHLEMIAKHGVSPHHRKSFSPIKEIVAALK